MPRDRHRQRVRVRTQTYELRGSEARTLATVGVFRAVPASDLRDHYDRPLDPRVSDLRHLRESGLVRTMPYLIGRTRTTVITLTQRGRDVLEALRRESPDGRSQAFYDGLRNPRELAHDMMVYRAYLRTADRLAKRGATIRRVVLDDELKREYQRFLQAANLGRPDSDGQPLRDEDAIERWAIAHTLPYEDGHVQFPDARIEYEDREGRTVTEDVEVETPHYRGGHASAKARSGFTRFQSAGSRLGGGSGRGGGAPFDPGCAEDLLS
ncbi:MAG: hypothetical protein AB7L71_00345 [Vicinamibacterales bacterium]